MENENPKHQRRVRYNGTHPKSFKEKYKELQPELYADDVAKIVEQGKTPAGMHRSICVNEIMEILAIVPGQIGMDATLGYGGHSLEILKRLMPGGILYATDVDPFELPRTQERLQALGYDEEKLIIRKMNFAGIDTIISESGLFDFVLADLGVSSMQIDNPDRGFSFKVDGPLDLRLNPTKGKSAAALLKSISEENLEMILQENADEPHSHQIAKAIKAKLAEGVAITTTKQLQEVIIEELKALPNKIAKEESKKTCQRCFQALRDRKSVV